MNKRLTTVLVKPAGADCNLACTYCFYLEKSRISTGFGHKRMSDDVLETFIQQLMAQSGRKVAVIWQGGEPTLMGLPFYRRAIALEQKYGRGKIICNSFQTNGYLIDYEWINFFLKYRFLVGLSLDGPKHIHDKYRKTVSGSGTWERVAAVAKRLLNRGVATNAIIVVNDYSSRYPEEIYDFHTELGFSHLQFIPCLEIEKEGNGVAKFSLTAGAYGEFLCRLFDRWRIDFNDNANGTSIRFFEAILAIYLDLPPAECTLQQVCGGYLVLNFNGDVYPCDFFVKDDLRLGNIFHERLDKMLNSETQTYFGERKSNLPMTCKTCEWIWICRGGCIKDRLRDPNDQGRNHFCAGLKDFFEHANPYFLEMAEICRVKKNIRNA